MPRFDIHNIHNITGTEAEVEVAANWQLHKDSILSRNVLGAPEVVNVRCLCRLECRRGRCQREASTWMVMFFVWRGSGERRREVEGGGRSV